MKKRNHQIEENARRLYAEILSLGKCSVDELRARTKFSVRELLLALGWLAREECIETDGREVHLLTSEFYF